RSVSGTGPPVASGRVRCSRRGLPIRPGDAGHDSRGDGTLAAGLRPGLGPPPDLCRTAAAAGAGRLGTALGRCPPSPRGHRPAPPPGVVSRGFRPFRTGPRLTTPGEAKPQPRLNGSTPCVTIHTMAPANPITDVLRQAIRDSGLPLLRIAQDT